MTKKEINNLMIKEIERTETPLRIWERRLIVALTDDEKQICKAKIKLYKNLYK